MVWSEDKDRESRKGQKKSAVRNHWHMGLSEKEMSITGKVMFNRLEVKSKNSNVTEVNIGIES